MSTADNSPSGPDTAELRAAAATVDDAVASEEDALEPILQVYSAGETTVVGFGGRDVLDTVNLAVCREELLDLIKKNGAKRIAFDLTGVVLMPSGLLGLLASLRKEGVEVHIYNPSQDVREVLEVTHLDQVMTVREVEVAK